VILTDLGRELRIPVLKAICRGLQTKSIERKRLSVIAAQMAELIVGIDQAFSAWQGDVYPPDGLARSPNSPALCGERYNRPFGYRLFAIFNACKRTTGPALCGATVLGNPRPKSYRVSEYATIIKLLWIGFMQLTSRPGP